MVAAIVSLGALVFAGGAQACSCAPAAPGAALQRADAAIVGDLVEVVPRDRRRADYRYRVLRAYGGGGSIDRGEVISVRSARDSAACGLPGRTEHRYGLFLVRDQSRRWTAGACSLVAPRRLRAVAGRAIASAASRPDGCAV